MIACIVGGAALAIAVLAGTPLVEAAFDRAIVWSTYPVVRGSLHNLFVVSVIVTLVAVSAELVFHGWLIERVLELAPHAKVPAVIASALAEALVMPGDLNARIGTAVFGAGLAWMYLAGGRSVRATIPGASCSGRRVVLEALRIIG